MNTNSIMRSLLGFSPDTDDYFMDKDQEYKQWKLDRALLEAKSRGSFGKMERVRRLFDQLMLIGATVFLAWLPFSLPHVAVQSAITAAALGVLYLRTRHFKNEAVQFQKDANAISDRMKAKVEEQKKGRTSWQAAWDTEPAASTQEPIP